MTELMIAVGALIRDPDGRLLLGKHTPERGGPWAGKWICPGGKLVPGETIRDGILREVREETGLKVTISDYIGAFDSILDEGALHVVYIDFLADAENAEAKAASDLGEVRWFTREELPDLRDELHPDTQRLLELAGAL